MEKLSHDELMKLAKSYEDEIDREKMQLRMTMYVYALISRELSNSKPAHDGNE